MIDRDYRDFINDILTALISIENFIKGISINELEKDDRTYSAVIRKLEIIGEASRRIPKTIKNEFSDIPWNKMIALRNIAIHEYFGIDITIIWEIITKNLPDTKPSIEKMIKDLNK